MLFFDWFVCFLIDIIGNFLVIRLFVVIKKVGFIEFSVKMMCIVLKSIKFCLIWILSF